MKYRHFCTFYFYIKICLYTQFHISSAQQQPHDQSMTHMNANHRFSSSVTPKIVPSPSNTTEFNKLERDECVLDSYILFFCCIFLVAGILQLLVSKVSIINIPLSIIWFIFGMSISLIVHLVAKKKPCYFTENIHDHKIYLFLYGAQYISKTKAEVIYLIFLPILLYDASLHIKWHHFKRFAYSGITLAVLGVAYQVAVVGILFYLTLSDDHLLVPNFDKTLKRNTALCNAFLITTSLVSTDPVAVISVLQSLNASVKLVTMFEGESLINDGTSVLLFQFFKSLSLGHVVSWNGILLRLLSLLFLAPVFGYFVGVTIYRTVRYFPKHPETQATMLMVTSYLVYFVSEKFISTSGPVAIVCYGIYYTAFGHVGLGREGHLQHLHSVNVLAGLANTSLFIIAGSITMRMLLEGILQENGVPIRIIFHIPIFYIYLILGRASMILLFLPLIKRLRGAIVLAMGLMIEQDERISPVMRRRSVLYIAGTTLFLLVINGASFEVLFTYLNAYPPKPFRRVYLERVMKHIDQKYFKECTVLKNYWLFQGTEVLKFANLVVPQLGWRRMDNHGRINVTLPQISSKWDNLLKELEIQESLYINSIQEPEFSNDVYCILHNPLNHQKISELTHATATSFLGLHEPQHSAKSFNAVQSMELLEKIPLKLDKKTYSPRSNCASTMTYKESSFKTKKIFSRDTCKARSVNIPCSPGNSKSNNPVLHESLKYNNTLDIYPEKMDFCNNNNNNNNINDINDNASQCARDPCEENLDIPYSCHKNVQFNENIPVNGNVSQHNNSLEINKKFYKSPYQTTARMTCLRHPDWCREGFYFYPSAKERIKMKNKQERPLPASSQTFVSKTPDNVQTTLHRSFDILTKGHQESTGQFKFSESFNTKHYFSNNPVPISKTSHPLHRSGTRKKRELIKHMTTPRHHSSDKLTADCLEGWTFFSDDDCDAECRSFDYKRKSPKSNTKKDTFIKKIQNFKNYNQKQYRTPWKTFSKKSLKDKLDATNSIRMLRREREGELYIMAFNAIGAMYKQLYDQHLINGAVLRILKSVLDSAVDFSVGKLRRSPILAWREACSEAGNHHLSSGEDTYRTFRLSEHHLQSMTAFEVEWRVLESRLLRSCKPRRYWGSFLQRTKKKQPILAAALDYKKILNYIQQLSAFVDVHEELLYRGGSSLSKLLGSRLSSSYQLQVKKAKKFMIYLIKKFPYGFPYALVVHAATLLIHFKQQLIIEQEKKGLLLEEDVFTLNELMNNQLHDLVSFSPIVYLNILKHLLSYTTLFC
ncbi:uncharacterized protein LOC128884079 isoform X3 [Hylaeus volcanicus]|uniref:uncharacterized protein LOC128884079 isoform X3 n=1 Tax=Hylaeus volcanicus TaxID=313075 RepID=UPI0023B86809|nr:uncharacterized protein LOC128884079 isoform X3 [Hylaeus volcanicus]